jgi:hypothetical protein
MMLLKPKGKPTQNSAGSEGGLDYNRTHQTVISATTGCDIGKFFA